MEVGMQRMVVKQVLFLFLLAAAIVLVMGVLFITNVDAQTTAFRFLPDWDWDWDDDWDLGGRVSPQIRYNRVDFSIFIC